MKRVISFVCVLASMLVLSQCKENKKTETIEPEIPTDTIPLHPTLLSTELLSKAE